METVGVVVAGKNDDDDDEVVDGNTVTHDHDGDRRVRLHVMVVEDAAAWKQMTKIVFEEENSVMPVLAVA